MSLINSCYRCTNNDIPTNLIVKELVFNYLGDIDVDSYLTDNIIKLARDATDKANSAADVVDNLVVGKVRTQDVSTVDGSTQDVKNIELFQNQAAHPFEGSYYIIDSFALGATITQRNQALRHAIDGKLYRWAGDLPKIVPVGSTPINTGGIGEVAWIEVSNIVSQQACTPYDFGVVGDFNEEVLGDRFLDLAHAKSTYPNAVSLTELADRVAFDAFLLHLIANNEPIANWGCKISIEQPLVSYTNAKTTNIAGDLYIQGVKKYISHALHIATKSFTFTGTIFVNSKTTNSLPNRELVHGVVMGAGSSLGLPKLAGSADNGTFGNVVGRGLLGFAFVGGQNAHFTRVNTVRGVTCGSAKQRNGIDFLQGIWDDFTSMTVGGSNVNQRAVLKISSSNMTAELLATLGGHQYMTATINGKPYDILGIDLTAKEITVYPAPPTDEQETGGHIMYHFGGAVHMGTDSGNNTSATSFGTIQAIVCGIGLDLRTLYGASISVLSTEVCGAGCVVGHRSAAHIGTTINLGYFEGNTSDILFMWSSSDGFYLAQTIALNMTKVWQMFGYTMPDGSRRDSWSHLYGARIGQFYGERNVLELHTRHSNSVLVVSGDSTRVYPLLLNSKFAELQFISSKSIRVILLNSKAELQFDAPEGYTINNGTSVILNAGDFDTHIDLFITWNVSTKVITLTVLTSPEPKGLVLPSGDTESRPLEPQVGSEYFDTTLSKPIYYDGTQWVDAIGEVV